MHYERSYKKIPCTYLSCPGGGDFLNVTFESHLEEIKKYTTVVRNGISMYARFYHSHGLVHWVCWFLIESLFNENIS
jgi:hypothetical protein